MKKILYKLVYITLFACLFSSCISSEQTNYFQDIPTSYVLKPYEEYKLSVGDMITCNISSIDEKMTGIFSTVITTESGGTQAKSFTIYENGTVVLPFFGTVKVVGLSLQEAEQQIQKMMQESIVDAQVKVSLTNNVFYTLANDKKGVAYVYKENLTIYQALAISGQTTEKTDISKVSIIRKGPNGGTITKTFDLRSQDVVQSDFYYIQPNDVIYFPTNRNAFFNVTSLSSFFTMVMAPVTFLIIATTYR